MSALHVRQPEPGADAEGIYMLPPVAVMARAACMSEREFKRGLKIAEREGWVVIRGNQCCLTVPDHLAHLVDEMIAAGEV